MEEEFGIFGPVNLGAKPFDLSMQAPGPVRSAPVTPNGDSAMDIFNSLLNQAAPKTGQGSFNVIPTQGLDLSGRYPKIFPGIDNENLYAQNQGTLEKLGNGLVKFGGIATTTFLNTTAGTLYGLKEWRNTGKFESVFDNPLTRELNEFNNEYLESQFANYKTQREREGEWWEPDNLFTANFLADNIIKNLGFAAGAFAGGFAWTGALRALGLSARLIAQGKNMAAATDAAIASATVLPQTQRLSAINTALNQLSSTARVATGRAFMGAERGIVSTIAAAGEAGIEALNASQEFRQSMIDKYIADNGFAPTGKDLEEINDTASDAGKTVYGLNFGLLSLSNFVQLPKIFSSTFKGEKNLVNDVLFKGGKWTSALPETTIGKSLYKARGLGRLLFNTDEALEEAAQYAAQVGTENYFSKLNETGDASVLDDLFFTGAKEALTSSEGLLNFTIGGVSGAIMGAPGRIAQKGFFGDGGKEKKVRDEYIDAWNKSLIKDRLKDRAKTINANEKIQQERAQKIVNGDISGAKDLEFDFLFGDMYNRAKYSSLENVNQETAELRQLASTDEGFFQLQQQGIAHATDNRPSFLNRLDTIERQAKQIDQIYQDTNLKFKGVLGEDKKPLYNDDVIKKLTYAAAKIYDYDNRIPSLNGKLINSGVNTTEVFNDVITNGKTPKETVDKALATIKDPVNADELTQDLFELIELGMKRKKFIDEYNEIKANPKKYTPAPETKPTVVPEEKVGEKVKIKTKAGEKEVSIGEEYSLGAPIDFQKDGLDLEVKSYNITVLGENEDGTIKIRTSSGKERDVSKEEFAKYNLIPISEIQSNKTAKYFDIHKNEIFEYNFGKNFGGKKQGRIEYRNGNLYFKYKDSKGRVQEKKLDRSHFVAQEGYDKARISIVGKVSTAAQKQAEAEYLEQKQLEIDVNKAQENRAKRIEILSNLIEETKQEQKDLDSLIAKKKAELQTIGDELSELEDKILSTTGDRDLRYKKGIRFKSSTRKALAAANRLSKMKDDLQSEISKLEARREDIEIDFSYLSDMAQNIEELPGATNEFLKELREHVSFVKDLIEEKENQISEIKGILPKVQEAIDSAIDFLSNLVSEFQKKFPKVPLSIGQEWIDFLKANPNFLKRKPTYTQELKQLEDMVAQVEDLDIEPGERTIQELNTSLKDLETDLSDLRNQLKSTEFVLSKFEQIAKLYLEQKAQEEQMFANEQLKKQILGTADNDNPVAPVYGKEFEPTSKKIVEIIPRATLGIDRGKPHQKRAQRFGLNFESFDADKKRNIKGVYITHKNQDQLIPGLMDHLRTDENGVNDTVNPKTTITMVMVDVSEGTPVLVNVDGEPLTEEQLQDPLNNAIYQVFPLEELKWSGEYGDESMFPENTPKNVKDAVIEQYTEWRKGILNIEDLSEIHSIDVSFGFPQIKTDSEGKKLYDTRTSVQDAGLVSEYQIENNPLILIATSDETIVRGISVTKSAPGRVFLEMGNGLVPMQNRRHTRKEAEVIFNAILQFSKNAFDKTKGVNDDQSVILLKFLRSVVYWGIPENEAGPKPSGYSSVFFNEIGGKLFMSGKGGSFPFTPSGLEQNREAIITVLSGMYHNVNGKMARDMGMEYEQITNISQDGTIESVTWPNYQAYLLSKTTPDGKERSGEQLPLSTNVRPLEGPDDLNRTGIYFYTTDTTEDFVIPEAKKAVVLTPVGKKKEEPLSGKPKAPEKFTLDNKTINTAVSPTSGRQFKFRAPANPSAEDITIVETPDAVSAYEVFEKMGVDPVKSLQETVLTIIQFSEAVNAGVEETSEEFSDEERVKQGKSKLFGKARKEAVEEEEEEVDDSERVQKGRAKLFGKKPADKSVEEEAKKRSEEISKRAPQTPRSKRTEFRLAVEKEAKGITIEDWSEIEAAWKQMLPNVPLYRLKNVIQATNGRQAWGMLKNGAIYVYENAEVGTFYHEVFEAIWKMFTSPSEQQAILNEFKSRKGTFVDRPTGKSIKYSEATPQQIKEQLAEEFRDYRLSKKLPPKPERGGSWISKLFADIVAFITKLFTGKDAQSNTEKLFEKIGNGYYAKHTPSGIGVLQNVPSQIIEQEEEFATEEDELREIIPYKQKHELMQQMAYTTLSMLGATDQSLFNVVKIPKSDLRQQLFDEILGTVDQDGNLVDNGIIGDKIVANNQNYIDGKISAEEFVTLDDFLREMHSSVNDQWNDLFAKYEEYMAQYQIEFDENDELQLRDEDKVKETDNVDALKIDSFRKANSAIKLLLATLPKTIRVNGIDETISTTVGGVDLLPLSQTFITVMNKLHASRDLNGMMENLRQLALEDGNYTRLYKRLAKKEPKDGKFDFKKLTTPHSIQLISSFWSTFKKMNPDVKNVFILDNEDVVIGDANLSKAAAQVASDYESGIIMSAREGKGYLEYNKDEKAYVANKKIDDLKFNSSNIAENDNAMLKFLADIGVEFTKEDFKKLIKEDKIQFRDAVSGIKKSLSQNKTLMTLSKKTISVQGRLTELALLKIKSSNPEIESTYFNLSGERTQSHIGVNPLSDLQDFINSTKDLSSNSVKESQYRYLVTDVFSKGSVILNKLYKKGGNKISDDHPDIDLLTVGYVGGTDNSTNGKRKPSSKLTYPERISQEMNLNLDGWYLNLVPGDASIEWMIKMGNHVSSANMSAGYKKVMEIFKEYFKAEYNLAKSPDRAVDASRESEKQNLRFFYDILGKELNNKIINSKKTDAEAVYNEFEKQIEAAVKSYVEQKTKNFRATLNKYGILQYDGASFSLKNIKESSQGSMYTISKNMNEQTMMNNLNALTVNYMIANIELHKLIYADPYQYKDELKRIKSFSSPRQAIMSDPDNLTSGYGINAALHDVWNAGFKKGEIGYTDFNRNYFRTVTHKDVIAVVDIPGQKYEDYKETDGSGIMTDKTNRNIGLRTGNWTENDERQYRHDVAYEKLFRAGATKEELDKFDEENNPGIQSAYTPKKPIVAGNIDNGQNYNDVVLDKFALYPLSFRILHKINPNSNAIKLYEKMQKEDIDYIVFDSGRKVGARNSHATYNEDGSFNSAEYVEEGKGMNILNIPYKIFSIQTEVPSKDKAEVTRGSQITKLLTMDFMASGVPVDFMSEEPNFVKRYRAWMALDEKGKNESKLYREIKNNEKLLVEMTKWGYQSLLKRFGIVESTVKGKKTYKIEDFSAAATTLRQEMLKREVNDNVIKSLESFLNGNVILEATPAYQQVRNILYSIVDKEVVSPKISGGMKVQIPSTLLLDSNNIKVDTINGKKGFVSESLKFYEKDGERVAEIMIGRWFDSSMSDEELMDYFNNDPEGKKQLLALFGVAFRIPTQNQNSIDAIKIAKFLPREFGDSVVIPSALVAKVGSDFDIDKLSIYLKNVYQDAKGNIKLVPFYGFGQQAIDKFKELAEELTQAKIAKIEKKILKQEGIRQTFVDIATGNTSSGFAQIWIPRFKQWFANEIVDGKLSVELVGEVFAKRFEKLNKKLDELTNQDLHEIFIQEYAERFYKESLQNEYIQSSENLIKSDYNYDKLMTPNSAKQLENLGRFIAEKTVGQSYDYRNVGNMLDRNFMSSLRHAFVTGKYAIGIAAVNQTNHSLMQRFMSFVDPTRLRNASKVDQKWLGDAKVKFQQFNQIDGKATLSMIKNAERSEKYPDGQFISDIIGQFIDGYVDISKGPWIMELGATPNVASTWLFLVKIGVPIDTVTYFMNQPIVRDYLQTIENAGYSWLFIDDFVESSKLKFKSSISGARTQIPNTDSLKSMVGKDTSQLSENEKADQQFILDEFLKYAKMAEHMFLVTQGTNYDTSNFNDPYLLYKKQEQFKKAQKTIISSVEEILENSFIGPLQQFMGDSRDAMAQMLISDRSNVRRVIQKVLQPYTDLQDRDFVKVAQRAVADLFDYAVQTNTVFKDSVLQTMVTKGGYAYDILQMIKEIKADPNHPLHDNHVINIITPQLAPEASPNSPNNIKIKGSSNKIYDQNSIIYGFEEIKDYFESIGEIYKYNKFKALTLFQSGLSVNRLAFTSLLPFKDFENLYNDTIQKLESIPNLETFADLNIFERNNWGNDDVVPYEKARWIKEKDGTPAYNPAMKYLPKPVENAVKDGKIPPVISVSTLGRKSNSDFFVFSWETDISKEKKAEMRKKGDFSYIKRGLFRKVKDPKTGEPFIHTSNEKEYYIYQAVNAWGARERAQEFYDVEKASELDNGFIKVLNPKADDVIIGLFKGGKGVTATATIAPTSKGKTIAIVGTAGRTKVPTLAEWKNMIQDASSRVTKNDTLISGGAAFADHIAVRLFLDGKVKGLKLRLPAKIKNNKFEGAYGTAGGTANYYHDQFSKLLGVNTISEIQKAIDKGAEVTYETETSNKAMFMRNAKVAAESNSMIAYTYGEGNQPADGGTKNTWDTAKYSDKTHVRIDAIGTQTQKQTKTQAPKEGGVREYTPENITSLKPNEVFVFGSNTEGRHGAGAAKTAVDKFGAKYGQPRGIQGQSYGIVTKDLQKGTKSIPKDDILKEVNDLMKFAKANPNKKFYVTKLGTELAGYSISEIKKIFEEVNTGTFMQGIPENVILPKEFEVRNIKSIFPKEGEMKLKNGKTYPYSKINSRMLEVIGYSPEEIGKILKSIC